LKNWLLTGKPGAGKSTIIQTVVRLLEGRARGFITEEIRGEGRRVGFRLRDLEGREGLLAHICHSSPHRVGRYGVKRETMQSIGVPALRRAAAEAELVVVDEIGRMELYCPAFLQAIRDVLGSPRLVLGVIQERALRLFPGMEEREDTQIIQVTPENRDRLPGVILGELKARLDSSGSFHAEGKKTGDNGREG
jgi:nucleoside-triphosphatase